MKQAFKSKITLGGEAIYGAKLAQAEFISKRHRLTTTLEVFEVIDPQLDQFIVTARNQLGWYQLYNATSLLECLAWLRGSRLPVEAVGRIVKALTVQPQAKRGRPAKPKVTYATRKRRDGSEVTVTVERGCGK